MNPKLTRLHESATTYVHATRHLLQQLLSCGRAWLRVALIALCAALSANAQDTRIVVVGPVVAFYFDSADKLIAGEWVSATRTIKTSAKPGLNLMLNAGDLPPPGSDPKQMGNGISATAVYVQMSRPDPDGLWQSGTIVAVEDLSGVADRKIVGIQQILADDDPACRCALVPCPTGKCCPKLCM